MLFVAIGFAALLVPVGLYARECITPIGDPLVLSCYVTEDSPLFENISNWYEMIFCQAGRRVQFKPYPIARDAVEVGDGRIDGTFYRIAEFGRMHPNLVRVDEPLFESWSCAYSKGEQFRNGVTLDMLRNWSGDPLKIGYTRGIVATKLLLTEASLKKKHRLFAMTDHYQCLRMLEEGRFDLVIGTSQLVEDVLDRRNMWRNGIYKAGTLDSKVGYIYLNAKYIDLAPRLEKAIRQSKLDGSFERMLGYKPVY